MFRLAGDTVATAGLALVLWIACMAVGRLILPRATAAPADRPPSWNREGLAAVVGLATLIALGGIGTFLHLPVWLIVGPFTGVGVGLAIARFVRTPWRPQPGTAVVITGLTIGAFLVVALVEARVGPKLFINQCDELRAYLPMAHRLLDTNAIIEPWSYRRLQNFGGFTYLQAIPVSLFGDVGISYAETVIASVFLAGFFVSTGLRTQWTRLVAAGCILVIPILWIPRVNSTAVLAAVPLLLGTYAITSELRGALRDGDRRAMARWAIAGGLVLAAIGSVRVPLLPAAALTIVLGGLVVTPVPGRDRLRAVAIAAGAAVVAIGGWLLAAWESVGTPLYPLIPGNANTAVPSERDPEALESVGAAVSRTFEYLNSGTLFWVVVAVVIVALVARKTLPDPSLVVIIAVAAIVSILVFTVQLSMAATRDFGRYIAPMSESIVVFLVYEILRALDARESGDRRPTAAGVLVSATAVLGAIAVFSPFAVLDAAPVPAGIDLLKRPLSGSAETANRAITPEVTQRNMNRALKLVDREHTILAVDRPYLVDYSRFDLPQLDLPGWATPTGTFPFFRGGAEAKIAALRDEGFTTMVATVPEFDRCLNPYFMQLRIRAGSPPGSTYARYFLDWEEAVMQIRAEAPEAVTRIGQLLVVDLDQAQDLVGGATR